MTELVCIKTFKSRLEAEFAKGLLEASGIQALVRADDEGGLDPLLILLGPGLVRLYVKQSDAATALKLLPAQQQKQATDFSKNRKRGSS